MKLLIRFIVVLLLLIAVTVGAYLIRPDSFPLGNTHIILREEGRIEVPPSKNTSLVNLSGHRLEVNRGSCTWTLSKLVFTITPCEDSKGIFWYKNIDDWIHY